MAVDFEAQVKAQMQVQVRVEAVAGVAAELEWISLLF